MQLAYTILYVDDVPASLAFYERAFGLARRFLHDSGDYAELDTGGTTLSLSARRLLRQMGKHPAAPVPGAPSFEIAFSTGDVAAAYARALDAGARAVQPPQAMPWGQTVAYVEDPEGFLVELCTPMVPPPAS
jgi:lactoylglutathione lyase